MKLAREIALVLGVALAAWGIAMYSVPAAVIALGVTIATASLWGLTR